VLILRDEWGIVKGWALGRMRDVPVRESSFGRVGSERGNPVGAACVRTLDGDVGWLGRSLLSPEERLQSG
jgi:hypothetical protein